MSFISLILDWYDQHKRPLPWRTDKNVYRVWLSEVILQQTRVNQGMDYYHRFAEAFPAVQDLAEADIQQVMKLWQGLGYYSRARNLHKAAQIIVNELNGNFPDNYNDLKKLPGIGPYTAAAIASIVFNQKVPAIDGNAYRVYARLFGIEKDISDSDAHRFFFSFAEGMMPENRPGDFNEAIMELGATVCTPQNPECKLCPVRAHCVAFATGKTDKLPVKTRKVKVKKRFFHYYFIQNAESGAFLIEQRKNKDVWQQLYQFPLVETADAQSSTAFLGEMQPEFSVEIKHILTHQQLFIRFYEIRLNEKEFRNVKEEFNLISLNEKDIFKYPFPKPLVSFLNDKFDK